MTDKKHIIEATTSVMSFKILFEEMFEFADWSSAGFGGDAPPTFPAGARQANVLSCRIFKEGYFAHSDYVVDGVKYDGCKVFITRNDIIDCLKSRGLTKGQRKIMDEFEIYCGQRGLPSIEKCVDGKMKVVYFGVKKK